MSRKIMHLEGVLHPKFRVSVVRYKIAAETDLVNIHKTKSHPREGKRSALILLSPLIRIFATHLQWGKHTSSVRYSELQQMSFVTVEKLSFRYAMKMHHRISFAYFKLSKSFPVGKSG